MLECVQHLEAKHLFGGESRERQAVQRLHFDVVKRAQARVDGHTVALLAETGQQIDFSMPGYGINIIVWRGNVSKRSCECYLVGFSCFLLLVTAGTHGTFC